MRHWKALFAGASLLLAGVALGVALLGAQPATAQTAAYSECFFGQQEVVDIDSHGGVASPGRNRMITVPRGYEVVSGGGNARADHGTILFCRR